MLDKEHNNNVLIQYKNYLHNDDFKSPANNTIQDQIDINNYRQKYNDT